MGHYASEAGIAGKASALLLSFGRQVTARHSRRVAGEAGRIAGLFGADVDQAALAGWLHDISAIIPPGEMVGEALTRGIEALPEERAHPSILHQKLSAALASELFGVTDDAILTAVSCHTTLRADAAQLDMILYAADKLAWDQSDAAPYEAAVRAGLEVSLNAAVLAHLRWMHDRQASLSVVHPRLRDAYEWLSGEQW